MVRLLETSRVGYEDSWIPESNYGGNPTAARRSLFGWTLSVTPNLTFHADPASPHTGRGRHTVSPTVHQRKNGLVSPREVAFSDYEPGVLCWFETPGTN
jgi:hypothetical protein